MGYYLAHFGMLCVISAGLSIQPRHHLALGLTVFLLLSISEFGFSTRGDQKTFKRQKNEVLIMIFEDIERALL